MKRGVSDRYMRGRLAVALTLMIVATIGSYVVDRAVIVQARAHEHVVEALDTILTTMAEQLVHLGGIRDAIAPRIAADDRNSLARSLPALEAAVQDLRDDMAAGAVSPGTLAVLENRLLNPLQLLDRVAANARTVVEDPDLWGERAAFHVATASATNMNAVKLVKRIKDIEREDFNRVADPVERWRLLGVVVVFGVLVLVWAGIFRPLELRVQRDQERLREGRQVAEAASEAKSAFVATVSHEIRTPLVGVLGAAELMRGTSLDPQQDELTETILSSGWALLSVLDDVLDFAKIEAGRITITPAPTDVALLVGGVGRLFEPQARAKGLELRVETEGELLPRHLADETRLRQILANLVGNAVKFTGTGRVTLRLRADPPAGEAQALRFEIEDTGVGMTPDDLRRMWNAFEQADGSTARRFGGTGLGLAIARRLTEAMDGRLSATSEPGRGSTFRLGLRLPAAPVEADGAVPAEDQEGPAAPVRPAGRAPISRVGASVDAVAPGAEPEAPPASAEGLLVLVADDNRVNRMIASRVLERAGCRVETACDGAEAVAAFERTSPRMILMDVSMPDMDGFEATRAIRAIERRAGRVPTRIAALSAHVGETHEARCREAGMDEVMGKPFRQSDITDALTRLAPLPGVAHGERVRVDAA